ncbi:MAG TPA: hypothetical protein VEY92_12490 [Pseudoxanthomonas sp.]|nr:hypothetical protein [Pseudoxanthomonas sp.]
MTVDARIAVNEAMLACECAADGFGIAFLPRVGGGGIHLWLVYPDCNLPAASRALVEFIVKELPAATR